MKFKINQRSSWGAVLLPVGVLISVFPSTSSAMALGLGILLALVFGNPYLKITRDLTKPLLAWSIVGLGAGVNLMIVLRAGVDGVVFTFISLLTTIFVGTLLGRWLRLDRETTALISVGTAICGGSAIAAVSAAIKAKDDSISVSLAIVFVLNALGLILFPTIGHFFHLSEQQFGLWGALAIHDTSSVVGATMQYGPQALEVGTTVKLVRALWIVPVSFLFSKFFVRKADMALNKQALRFPWFIGGFLLSSAIVTWFEILQPLGHQVEWTARRVLVVTLFMIGCGMTFESFKRVGLVSLVHAVILWALVSSLSLTFVTLK